MVQIFTYDCGEYLLQKFKVVIFYKILHSFCNFRENNKSEN